MASIVMLAFVVFPHHHHNEYICFATAHCQDEGENEEHSHDTGCLLYTSDAADE